MTKSWYSFQEFKSCLSFIVLFFFVIMSAFRSFFATCQSHQGLLFLVVVFGGRIDRLLPKFASSILIIRLFSPIAFFILPTYFLKFSMDILQTMEKHPKLFLSPSNVKSDQNLSLPVTLCSLLYYCNPKDLTNLYWLSWLCLSML